MARLDGKAGWAGRSKKQLWTVSKFAYSQPKGPLRVPDHYVPTDPTVLPLCNALRSTSSCRSSGRNRARPLPSSPDLFHFRPSFAIACPQPALPKFIKRRTWTTFKSEVSSIMNEAPRLRAYIREYLLLLRNGSVAKDFCVSEIHLSGSTHIKDRRKFEIPYSKMQTIPLLFIVIAVGAQAHRPIKAMSMQLATSPRMAAQHALSHAPDYNDFGN